MMRGASGDVVPEWQDFWSYVSDIGTPPSAEHRLYRIKGGEPYGPKNTEWREIIASYSQDNREARNAYMREYSRQRPSNLKRAYLKRHYKVSLEWYEEKWREQKGLCKICNKPERRIDPRSGTPYLLAVDHDHATKAPRDLLCSFCNHGLGNFDDDISRLRAAIAYLESHAVSV